MATKKINAAFRDMGLDCAEEFYSCTSGYSLTDHGFEIPNVYMTDRIVSVRVSGSYYCGNASIEDWDASYNFDAVTGKRLKLEDVIYFRHLPVEKRDKDDPYPSEAYATELVGLLTRLYPKQMQEQKDDQKCDYSNTDVWQFASWYFTPAGIFIMPKFRHFVMECGEETWSEIPYHIARKYKKPSKI